PLTAQLQGLNVEPDDQITLLAYALDTDDEQAAVARLLPDGSPNTGFGNQGITLIDLGQDLPDVYLLSDGTILSIDPMSYGALITRYNADGTPVDSFGDHGVAQADFGKWMWAADN